VNGSRWTFTVDPQSLPRPIHADTRFVLSLLETESLRYLELAPQSVPGADRSGDVVFTAPDLGSSPDATPSTVGKKSGAPQWAWSLEFRCGDACIARASGRR
jgi:hypothetical protein